MAANTVFLLEDRSQISNVAGWVGTLGPCKRRISFKPYQYPDYLFLLEGSVVVITVKDDSPKVGK